MSQLVELVSLKKSIDSFYVTDSPLSGITNIAQMAMFYIEMTILNEFP